jgi:hypothetical protein
VGFMIYIRGEWFRGSGTFILTLETYSNEWWTGVSFFQGSLVFPMA